MRVLDHPVLGPVEERQTITIMFDGVELQALEGEPIAATLLAAGCRVCRYTRKRREPRGVFCAIGRCTDCMMTVDGIPNVRTCVTSVRAAMVVETQYGEGRFGTPPGASDEPGGDRAHPEALPRAAEFAVVGAGPAGLSAAVEAARAGVRVVVFDENANPGGRLFKQIHECFGSPKHYAGSCGIDVGRRLLAQVESSGGEVMLNTAAWGIFAGPYIGVVQDGMNSYVNADAVLLSTGATDIPLAFPGWTLPGVMGAGAVQTLVNIHRVLPGKRTIVVGSGNIGLIVALQLVQAGAEVTAIVESSPDVGGNGLHITKLRRNGVPVVTSTRLKEVTGIRHAERAVTIQLDESRMPIAGSEHEWDVDLVCLAVGMSPLAELAWMAGCEFEYVTELGAHVPLHDANMHTTVSGIYVAGDVVGIEDASSAMEEGKLAGVAVAQSLGKASNVAAETRKQELRNNLQELRMGRFGQHRDTPRMRMLWQR